jgi:hypothetical protein
MVDQQPMKKSETGNTHHNQTLSSSETLKRLLVLLTLLTLKKQICPFQLGETSPRV